MTAMTTAEEEAEENCCLTSSPALPRRRQHPTFKRTFRPWLLGFREEGNTANKGCRENQTEKKEGREGGNSENGVSPVEEKKLVVLAAKERFPSCAWRFLLQQKQSVLERERETEYVSVSTRRHCCSIATAKGLLWFFANVV